jgi:hypothetical protein
MSTKTDVTVNAEDNAALVNEKVSEIMAEEKKPNPVTVVPPSDTVVKLPCGYATFTGEVVREAEVRELTGKDEEAIARASNVGKALLSILSRGVVSIGNQRATEEMLDSLLTGDRDMLLLGIYKATFGNEAVVQGICNNCNELHDISIDLNKDLKVRPFTGSRKFTLKGKAGEIIVQLPNGFTQKELVENADKSVAELTTLLLENCVESIDDVAVVSKEQVQNLGITDRKTIAEEINKRSFGPLFEEVAVQCPKCEGEVNVPLNLGTLFRF